MSQEADFDWNRARYCAGLIFLSRLDSVIIAVAYVLPLFLSFESGVCLYDQLEQEWGAISESRFALFDRFRQPGELFEQAGIVNYGVPTCSQDDSGCHIFYGTPFKILFVIVIQIQKVS